MESLGREKKASRDARCYEYQHLFFEVLIEQDFLSNFPNDEGMGCYHSPNEYSEKILDLQEELMKTIWKIAKKGVTKHQFKILKLTFEGKTQAEIGKAFGLQQSTIHKSLNGSRNDKGGSYGGSYKRLRKLIIKDEKVVRLLNEIEELTNRRL